MKKSHKQKKEKNLFSKIILLFSIILFLYSSYNIYNWFKDNSKTDKQINTIIKQINVTEIKDNEKTEIITPKKKEPKESLYWKYINMPLIDVDFNNLKKINSEVVGWISLPGTNINYPFVQTKDNSYYLTKAFDKTKNKAGWIFLDYRNNIQNLNKNTIIYGHARVNNTMFGTLKNVITNKWFNNKDNHIINISTEHENSLWQIFSVYTIEKTSDYIQTDFIDDSEFQNFINLIKNRSIYNFDSSIDVTDNILTLSTCHKTNERIVVHAKLIKKEAK